MFRVTPEANHSIPGELKNAFDHTTRELEAQADSCCFTWHGWWGTGSISRRFYRSSQSVPIPKFGATTVRQRADFDEVGNLPEAAKVNPLRSTNASCKTPCSMSLGGGASDAPSATPELQIVSLAIPRTKELRFLAHLRKRCHATLTASGCGQVVSLLCSVSCSFPDGKPGWIKLVHAASRVRHKPTSSCVT